MCNDIIVVEENALWEIKSIVVSFRIVTWLNQTNNLRPILVPWLSMSFQGLWLVWLPESMPFQRLWLVWLLMLL